MEARDTAYFKFKEFLTTLTDSFWSSISTEADTRLKLIDPIFHEILGWPKEEILTESSAGSKFIDYRMTINGLSRLIVEAKRESRELGIAKDLSGKFLKLNGAVFSRPTEAVKEGLEQAVYYCSRKSAELACLTNGREWIIFRGNRLGDGRDIFDGAACCFGDLDKVLENFNLFYDLLSYDSVAKIAFRAKFIDAEGQPGRHIEFRKPVRTYESANFLAQDKLHQDLDRIMVTFFQDLTGSDDPEARRACFVTTTESYAAEQSLLRISEEIRSSLRELETASGDKLTELIRRVQEMKRKQMVLLVGTKGAGKTTFIDRFFYDVLPPDLAKDCSIVRIDLAKSGCDAAEIIKWLDNAVLEEAEKTLFPGKMPNWDDYVGMFFGDYQRFSGGYFKHLYETDKLEFKKKFGEHIQTKREEYKREYIINLLHRTSSAHQKVPCLIFDNADHYDVEFQQKVFQFAHSLYTSALCLVILPITDTTSWQLSKAGAMQSFYTESFFLPTPPTELILKRRIEYIEAKIQAEKPQKGQGYFLSNGIGLSLEHIRKFAACLQAVFLNTNGVSNWIGKLSNQDIRRSLQLTREIVSSPHIQVVDLLKSYMAGTAVQIDPDDIKIAITKGKYDIYSLRNSFVQNIFDLDPSHTTTPLLGLRILMYMGGVYESNKDNDARYVSCTDICNYFQGIGIETQTTLRWLDQMLRRGLLLSYDPTITMDPRGDTKLEISPAGQMHLVWGSSEPVYLECMAEVTPILTYPVYQVILTANQDNLPFSRRQILNNFCNYLMDEDKAYCSRTDAPLYRSQNSLLDSLIRVQSEANNNPIISPRYKRRTGVINNMAPNGFGFITQDNGDNLFFHVSHVLNKSGIELHRGIEVEYDCGKNDRGPCALNVVPIAQSA